MNAKSLADTGLGKAMTACAAAKTKPIPGVEIASSLALLAMTDGCQGVITRSSRLGAVGQACKTKPIWVGGIKREVLNRKKVTSVTGDSTAVQNKANSARTGPVSSGETYAWGHRASLL